MAYETEDKFISRNYTQGRPGLDMTPFFIVHTYNGPGRSLYNWFQNNSLGISAHKARFKDGKGERYVRREDTSHGAGNWWANVRGINIEHMDDGNPSDSVRTAEQYEGTAQDIAQEAFELGHRVLNESNIKPHWDFTSTGCPGGLDIDRIRRRSNEILQLKITPPAPPIPEWKKNAKDIGVKTFRPQKDFKLYNLENGSVVKEFLEGIDVTVRYLSGNYYITEYSYNNSIAAGFKKEDLEYIKPDVITFRIERTYKDMTEISEYADEETARVEFVKMMDTLKPREVSSVYEFNKTKNIVIRIIDKFIGPDEIVYVILSGDENPSQDKWQFKNKEEAKGEYDLMLSVLPEGKTIKFVWWNKTTGEHETLESFTKPIKPTILKSFWEFIKRLLEFLRVIKS